MTAMNKKQNLSETKILVIGAGYVGIPLAILAASHGNIVYLFDKDDTKCKNLRAGETFINNDLDKQLIQQLDLGSIRIMDSANIAEKNQLNFSKIIICVPTPIDKNYNPDLSMVSQASKTAVECANKDTLIILESSTYPGTTRELIAPLLKERFNLNENEILLAYSPERVDPGNTIWNSQNTPRLVSGLNEKSTMQADEFYRGMQVPTYKVDSIEVAEAAKLFENTFRLVNIAFVNEISTVLRKLKIDPRKVLEAAYTKPFGIMKFQMSAGIGGHCIPVDPYYLTWWAQQNQENLPIVEAAQFANKSMPVNIADRIVRETGLSISNLFVVLVGITYKKGIRDARETPAFGIWRELEKRGARLEWWDSLIDSWDERKKYTDKAHIPDLCLIVTPTEFPEELKLARRIINLSE